VIRAEKTNFTVSLMCRVFEVSRSGYYAWELREVCRQNRKDEEQRLLEAIEKSNRNSLGTYGSPRIKDDLDDLGETVGRTKVARIMKKNNITGLPKPKWINTTDSAHDHPVASNILDRKFDVHQPNRVWVGDITYIWTVNGWNYLATVIDLCGRRVVGWALDDNMETGLILRALDMAVKNRTTTPGLLFHSDRGSQYASNDFQKVLTNYGIKCSMSRKGNCWDNAVAESFFATIKRELINRHFWIKHENLRAAIFEYIEVFYNRKRKHSTNGNLSPVDYENSCIRKAAVAA
jgi:putative transposase